MADLRPTDPTSPTEAMTTDVPDPSSPTVASASRRSLLRTGALGLFASAVLAACGGDDGDESISGVPATTTVVPPTVPVTVPNELALADDVVQLRTLQSVEVFAAGVYGAYGPKLSSTELRATTFRFQTDHDAIAEVFGEENGDDPEASASNAYLEENILAPAASMLTTDTAILNFLAGVESSLAATYVNATGILTDPEWRQRAMSFGAASARRLAVLGDGGEGQAPTAALFPLVDLIPGEAYLGPADEEAEGS